MADVQTPSLWLPALSGTALCLSFPNFSLFPLAWIALAPFLIFLLQRPGWKRTLLGHLVFSSLYFGGILYWIPEVLVVYGKLARPLDLGVYVLLLLLMAIFLAPFSLLVRRGADRSPQWALASSPGLWILTEMLRNHFAANGFPWALLGYTQFSWISLMQIADLSGIFMVSALVVWINAGICAALLLRRPKMLLLGLMALFLSNLYGAYRLYLWSPTETQTLRVALVQPAIALAAGPEYYAKRYFEDLPRYLGRAVGEKANWVIFPEAQNPYYFDSDFYFRTFWQREVSRNGVYLLLNSTFSRLTPDYEYFNSVALLDPHGNLAYRYDKIELVPFGEYIPFSDWLTFAEPLVHEVSSFSPGQELVTGVVGGLRFATLICYEGIFPELARGFVNEGAEVLLNLTNDAWFGQTAAPRQHFEMSAVRSIETRKTLLRCANSGISAVVDPWGRALQRLELDETGLIVTEVAGNLERPIYVRIGDSINILAAGLSVLLIWSGGRVRPERMN